ncbi:MULTISPECIES: hypothetical protein [Corynebacterium]|uniref:Uncharacterized protein n=2 Tax=Corynebacterium TaxID=1716 RepID=A0ACC4UAF7_9CORY|nr:MULTISPECIES: hypothetical protein [Corynebacterium]KKO79569.1 hypothetical protein WU87_07310 [Corynebacterium minutissimum]OFK66634.1 hypothetical protein HMPREF2806_09815 [Corynebacterium sp. HMSC076G08]OFO98108.1 hypothetical protein HMPREF3009_03085 [Corynebacterium sp. HMSC034H07]OFP31937.1 hypothetical protein HMPREF2993_06850 [Corynebacterium sp. HMSC068G04]OFQ53838.1 hypothetical protein HMPREF2932_00280 [Corynebacterium sp. HMSC074H12]
MKIYGYPGDRVDFVSKSGGAGAMVFGDPRQLAEEFFGTPHTDNGEEISYFSGSIVLRFTEGKLSEVSLFPGKSKHEKVDIYLAKTRLSGLDPETLRSAAGDAVEVEWDGALQSVTFR